MTNYFNFFFNLALLSTKIIKYPMKTYDKLSKIPFLKKYSFKFLFVAFIGIHIPLIGLIIFLIFGGNDVFSPLSVFISVLLFTLLAAILTLFVLNKLLEPIIFAKKSLSSYITNKSVPNLPTKYTDEIGILLKEIQFSVQTLDELINEKQDLIGLMSHDLKNPLAAVMTYSELIPSADTDEKRENLKEKISSAAKVQKEIINAVLDLLEREEIIITPEMMTSVNLEELFKEIESIYSEEITNKKLNISYNLEAKTIRGRMDLLKQVFSNIISNAIKFTPDGGDINVHSYPNGNDTVVKVADSGIGFLPEVSETIFNRFTKEKRKGTKGESTTGLGLYLCRKIIDRHSGNITATSAGNGSGSTFQIVLPK